MEAAPPPPLPLQGSAIFFLANILRLFLPLNLRLSLTACRLASSPNKPFMIWPIHVTVAFFREKHFRSIIYVPILLHCSDQTDTENDNDKVKVTNTLFNMYPLIIFTHSPASCVISILVHFLYSDINFTINLFTGLRWGPYEKCNFKSKFTYQTTNDQWGHLEYNFFSSDDQSFFAFQHLLLKIHNLMRYKCNFHVAQSSVQIFYGIMQKDKLNQHRCELLVLSKKGISMTLLFKLDWWQFVYFSKWLISSGWLTMHHISGSDHRYPVGEQSLTTFWLTGTVAFGFFNVQYQKRNVLQFMKRVFI